MFQGKFKHWLLHDNFVGQINQYMLCAFLLHPIWIASIGCIYFALLLWFHETIRTFLISRLSRMASYLSKQQLQPPYTWRTNVVLFTITLFGIRNLILTFLPLNRDMYRSNDKEESLGAFKERMKKARVTDIWPPGFVRNPLLPKGKSIEMLSPG